MSTHVDTLASIAMAAKGAVARLVKFQLATARMSAMCANNIKRRRRKIRRRKVAQSRIRQQQRHVARRAARRSRKVHA